MRKLTDRSDRLLEAVLAGRRADLGADPVTLAALAGQGRLEEPLDSVCRSVLHLHLNRLLGIEPAQERLVLGLLSRTYRTRRATTGSPFGLLGP